MQDFPGNSQRTRNRPQAPPPVERANIEQVTTAEKRKPGLGRRFKETFIIASPRETVEFMVAETVIPAIRDMMFDAFESGLQRMIYGESTRTRRSATPSYSSVPRVNYQSMSKPVTQQVPAPRMLSNRSRMRHDFGDILIDSRREADEVIEMLYEILSRNESVSIADLYALTNIAPTHVDHKWGWTSLQGAKAARQRDGRFLLDLPEPVALN